MALTLTLNETTLTPTLTLSPKRSMDRYMENLLGGVWPQDKERYEERAPVNAVDKLDCPILLLQGDEDKVD